MPYLRKQITIKERIVEDLPTLNQIYRLLIHDLTYAGKLQVAGRIEDAKAIYRQAMKHAEKGVADDPQSKEDRNVEWVQWANTLADAVMAMGIALDDLDALSDAELAVRISLGLLEEAYQSHACHTSEVAKTYSSCAVAHTNLGYLLINKGEFRQAAEILRRAHQFGSKNPFWPYLSAQWVQNCERLVEVKGRLLAIGSRSDPKVIWKGGR